MGITLPSGSAVSQTVESIQDFELQIEHLRAMLVSAPRALTAFDEFSNNFRKTMTTEFCFCFSRILFYEATECSAQYHQFGSVNRQWMD